MEIWSVLCNPVGIRHFFSLTLLAPLAARCSLLAVVLLGGCANIMAPTGGPKDTEGPKLLSVSPADSALNIRPARIELRFDEYVVVGADAAALSISPLTPVPPVIKADGRRIIVTLPDTALLEETTYRISLGGAVADLHEANPFGAYTYTFSTGAYFDSLNLSGSVVHAETAAPDSGIAIALFPADAPDSAVLRTKPLYITRTDALGDFRFEALPNRPFRIYAVADASGDLLWSRGERFASSDSTAQPRAATDSPAVRIRLRSYTEGDDSAVAPAALTEGKRGKFGAARDTAGTPSEAATPFSYSFPQALDTGARRRTADLTAPLLIRFTAPPDTFRPERIFLAYDSAGTTIEVAVRPERDTTDPLLLRLHTAWLPDAVYSLRLLRGFATDTAGAEAPADRLRFRTKKEEDYGTVQLRIPTRFYGRGYLLRVEGPAGPVYNAPVTDSTVRLRRLSPGAYSARITADRNRNGRWDGGVYGEGRQPEVVFPHRASVPVKAGWDAIVDFVPVEEGARKVKSLPKGVRDEG